MYPRAEYRSTISGGVIPASGAGDDRQVNVSVTPPMNFAYVLAACTFVVISPVGGTTGFTTAYSDIQINSDPIRYVPCGIEHYTTSTLQQYVEFNQFSVTPPKEVFLPDVNQTVSLGLNVLDPLLNQAECFLHLHCRWLQYDVTQAHHIMVNTPQLVR